MQKVQISFYATVTTLTFIDGKKAKAAYQKICTALEEYRRFKNDTIEVIEVECETGMCTVKLERIDSILLERGTDRETILRHEYEFERAARSMREELGLPDLPPIANSAAR